MRRFSFVLCAFLALSFYLTHQYNDEPVAENAPPPDLAVAKAGETAASANPSQFFEKLLAESAGSSASAEADEVAISQVTDAETKNAYQANDLSTIAQSDDALTTQTADGQVKGPLESQPSEKAVQKPVVIADAPRAAQEELKRLGCYAGRVDGVWGRKSRRALRGFNRSVEEDVGSQPDTAMVLMLRNYPDAYCTNKCSPAANRPECAIVTETPADQNIEAAGHTNNSGDSSYLPPWMRGDNAVLVKDEDAAWNGSTDVDGIQPQPKAQPRKARRRSITHDNRRRATAQPRRHKRSAQRNDWGLKNWPGQ